MNYLRVILQNQRTGDGMRNGKKVSIVLRMVDRCALYTAVYIDKSFDSSDETDHQKAKIPHRQLCS